MKLRINGPTRVVFKVKSFDQCRAFYEKQLELHVEREWDRGPGDRGVVYELGPTHLELIEADHDPTGDDTYLYIPVEDVDATWESLSETARVVAPIASQPWGHRNFMIMDPAGVKLKFFTPLPPTP